jgi:hypothetical protein
VRAKTLAWICAFAGVAVFPALPRAESRLYATAAVGEIPKPPADDMGLTGAQWQAGVSAEYANRFVLAFAQPWIGYYTRGPHLEGVAGAGAGIPVPWIRGHAWLLGEAVIRSVNVPTFPDGSLKPDRQTRRTFGVGARLDAWRWSGAFVGFDDVFPSWRLEAAFRLNWPT